jgi:hypothetical protein
LRLDASSGRTAFKIGFLGWAGATRTGFLGARGFTAAEAVLMDLGVLRDLASFDWLERVERTGRAADGRLFRITPAAFAVLVCRRATLVPRTLVPPLAAFGRAAFLRVAVPAGRVVDA